MTLNIETFAKAKFQLNTLVGNWVEEKRRTISRRNERYIDVDVDKLREAGTLDADETFIPDRVIDGNIKREKPPFVAYLTQSENLVHFTALKDQTLDASRLALEVSRGLTYAGWINHYLKVFDGTQTHGWAALEVVEDLSLPLQVGVEYIAHEKLIFNLDEARDLQDEPFILVENVVNIHTLEHVLASKYDFNPTTVSALVNKHKEVRGSKYKSNDNLTIYRVYFKDEDGVVFLAWCSLDEGPDEWLKSPEKLNLGVTELVTELVSNENLEEESQESRIPTDMTEYPIFILPYVIDEQETISSVKGRVFLDRHKQEAKTSIITGYVNSANRASNVFASPANDTDDVVDIKQLDTPLANGRLFNKKIDFFHQDYPDPTMLNAAAYFDTHNLQDAGQVNFAAQNRKDSRKTAKEIETSEVTQGQVNSVQVITISAFMRSVLGFQWKIIQSKALNEEIPLLINPQTGTNDVAIIGMSYIIRAAGDIEYIRNQQLQQKMQQDWPVLQTTGAKDEFLSDLIRLRYPERGEKYAALISQGNEEKKLIMALATMLQKTISPDEIAALPPDQQQQFQSIMQQAQQVIQGSDNGGSI